MNPVNQQGLLTSTSAPPWSNLFWMKTRLMPFPARLILFMLLLSGCTSAVQSGHNTALDSVDLLQMTDQMAASLIADPKVQETIARDGPMKVVVEPVENRMTAEVLPRGQAEAFTARVRALLSKHYPEKFTWVMNRDSFYRLRGQELD